MKLLEAVSVDGFDVHSAEVREVLATARRRRIAILLCNVVGDDSTPDTVRSRALRLILRDLGV